jgi:hypothetical protein
MCLINKFKKKINRGKFRKTNCQNYQKILFKMLISQLKILLNIIFIHSIYQR